MELSGFDFLAMQDIPPRMTYRDTPRLSLTEKGLVAINGALRRMLGEQREFRVKISGDGRYLALCAGETPNLRFSRRDGRVYHSALLRLMTEKGFSLPVNYVMEWHEEYGAWIGCCTEMDPPPMLCALAGPAGGRRRKAAGRQT